MLNWKPTPEVEAKFDLLMQRWDKSGRHTMKILMRGVPMDVSYSLYSVWLMKFKNAEADGYTIATLFDYGNQVWKILNERKE